MRIVRPICCGADVHKELIVATIAQPIRMVLPNTFKALFLPRIMICLDLNPGSSNIIALKSLWKPPINTGFLFSLYWRMRLKYLLSIQNTQKQSKVRKQIRKIQNGLQTFLNTIFSDSLLFHLNQSENFVNFKRYRVKLIGMRSSERNRYQNSMTMSNIGLASILSDPFGKSSRAVMKEVMNSSLITEEKLFSLLKRNAKKKVKKVLMSLEGSHIESDQRLKMNIATEHMDQLDSHIDRIERDMMIRCIPYRELISLLIDIPGLSPLSAMMIIAEIGTDMSVFESDKQLACWAGLAPANNESAGKKKSVRISKAGSYLKPLLVQCALAAINSKSNPYYRIKYNRIKKRRGHKKDIIAVARMLLVNVYHILSTGEVYNPCDMEQVINPKPVKKVMTIENAIELLNSQGFDTPSLILSQS